jgi:hypothetical protein
MPRDVALSLAGEKRLCWEPAPGESGGFSVGGWSCRLGWGLLLVSSAGAVWWLVVPPWPGACSR